MIVRDFIIMYTFPLFIQCRISNFTQQQKSYMKNYTFTSYIPTNLFEILPMYVLLQGSQITHLGSICQDRMRIFFNKTDVVICLPERSEGSRK